ncbi:FRG domain-containing protein [Formicincola oecophyllae]|uniref:FRG domain-containing protein n=1 Tax=Formicincola oecophyllae TaxID=2558361 RepID=A0A4Y6U9H2_9PROT|nr:FRG domain-containing protein [Formicincola oecophyllae]QDH13854.1 FRG domain-containing protein [Formicincola oecophyllae]
MAVKEIDSVIDSVGKALEICKEIQGGNYSTGKLKFDQYNPLYFRGQNNETWELTPTVFRDRFLYYNESFIYNEALSAQPEEFRDDLTIIQKLVRMQHFSIPTRLLDISEDMLIGLYFACCDDNSVNGNSFVFNPKTDHICFESDPYINALSSLIFSSTADKLFEIDPDFLEDKILIEGYKEILIEKRSEIFNKMIKNKIGESYDIPTKLKKEIDACFNKHFLLRPRLSNKRIVAQKGSFILFGPKNKSLDEDYSYWKIPVASAAKERILDELDTFFGINESTVFPDLDHLRSTLQRKYSSYFYRTPN